MLHGTEESVFIAPSATQPLTHQPLPPFPSIPPRFQFKVSPFIIVELEMKMASNREKKREKKKEKKRKGETRVAEGVSDEQLLRHRLGCGINQIPTKG